MRCLRRFISAEDGATSIEYCMIGGLVAVLIVAGVTLIGTRLSAKFFTPALTAFQ